MSEVNKVLVLRGWEELVNQKNLDAFDEFYAADAVHHEPDQDLQGLLISAEIAKRSLVGSLLMDNSLSKEATDWREGRRLRAFELKQQGWSQQRIAEALGVSKGAVGQWMKRARDGGGVEALRRRPD